MTDSTFYAWKDGEFQTAFVGTQEEFTAFLARRGLVSGRAPDAPDQTREARKKMVASAMQVRLALLSAGRLAEVEAIVAAADTATQIAWDKAGEFRRLSPTIAALAPAANPPFSDADLDALFTAAMGIEV